MVNFWSFEPACVLVLHPTRTCTRQSQFGRSGKSGFVFYKDRFVRFDLFTRNRRISAQDFAQNVGRDARGAILFGALHDLGLRDHSMLCCPYQFPGLAGS